MKGGGTNVSVLDGLESKGALMRPATLHAMARGAFETGVNVGGTAHHGQVTEQPHRPAD